MGDGPPLIHLPGFPFSNLAGEWRIPAAHEAFERLARDVRLIQYDGRGTGHSQRDVTDFSLDAMLGDLDAVVGAAGLAAAQVSLLGFYASVPTAIAYAARHWDRVSHLVLFGGSAVGHSPMSGPETQALLSLIERDWNVFVESNGEIRVYPCNAFGSLINSPSLTGAGFESSSFGASTLPLAGLG